MFQDLASVIAQLKNESQIICFLESILTEKERQAILQRIAILQQLEAGTPHHEIAKELHVGVATVTRGTKVLKQKSYQKIKSLLCME